MNVNTKREGTPSWIGLITTDITRPREFYTKMFKWMLETRDISTMVFKNNEQIISGLKALSPSRVSRWMVYYRVENIDDKLEKSLALGTKQTTDTSDIPEGRIVELTDPDISLRYFWV